MVQKVDTLIPPDKLEALLAAARQSLAVPGDMAELGVYQGGSAWHLAQLGRALHLFDTFEGLPSPSSHDTHRKGEFAASLTEVMFRLDGLPVLFHVGEFPHVDLPDRTFCFVHLDCDLYQSYKDGLAFFWPRLSSGGFIVLDDFDEPTCPGATLAAHEFFTPLGIAPAHVVKKP